MPKKLCRETVDFKCMQKEKDQILEMLENSNAIKLLNIFATSNLWFSVILCTCKQLDRNFKQNKFEKSLFFSVLRR